VRTAIIDLSLHCSSPYSGQSFIEVPKDTPRVAGVRWHLENIYARQSM